MSQQALGRENERFPTFQRIWRAAWPFVSFNLGFVLAFSAGADACRFIFGHSPFFILFPPIGLMLGFLLGTPYWIRHRTGQGAPRAMMLTASLAFATLFILHFVRFAPKRFEFLGSAQVAFTLEPMVDTCTLAVYTFPADSRRLFASARTELEKAGYKVEVKGTSLAADRSYRVAYPGSVWPVDDSVTITPGRSVTKRFNKEAEDVVSSNEEGWVTAQVAQPELLPFWLRFLAP
jgi:hypothetical protein